MPFDGEVVGDPTQSLLLLGAQPVQVRLRQDPVEAQKDEVEDFTAPRGDLGHEVFQDVVTIVPSQDDVQLAGQVLPARSSRLRASARQEGRGPVGTLRQQSSMCLQEDDWEGIRYGTLLLGCLNDCCGIVERGGVLGE